MLPRRRLHFLLTCLLFVVYFINGIIVITNNSVVSDESEHLYYGLRVLNGQPQKVFEDDASTQPVSAFNAIPRAIEQVLTPGLKKTDGGTSDAINGRYISLLIGILIGLYIYRWSREMFGEKAGLFSLFLFTFCPNLQANIPLVGTDAFAALITLTTAYYFRRFLLTNSWRNFVYFSIQIGLALVIKQSLFLLPVFFAVASMVVLIRRQTIFKNLKINITRLLVLVLVSMVIINIAFLFTGTGQSLVQYEFKSDTFERFRHLGFLSSVPLPLPVPFVEGYDQVKYMISLGSGHAGVSGRSYLLGSYFTGNSVWYYYSVVILFKTPLSVLLFLLATLVFFLRKPFSAANLNTIGLPLSLAFFFLIFISFNNTSQHGLRHLLMIYPLFYVTFGRLVTNGFLRKNAVLIPVMLYSLATFYLYFPNLLSYTNELIWNKTNAYRVLASTNIDHGQGGFALKRYLDKHPGTRWPGQSPEEGNFIVGINDYLDLKQKNEHNWLNQFQPYDHVNHCYLLFHITQQELEAKKLVKK